ncbi:ABC transporter ATP-binding protein [Streptomyces atratus]|uniref:ABC transporter ATP-binding protein n=1 Tax=Streptomyces atratus TaxID=1893 RepID=UPI0019A7F005|nr:ABC transporter ATP-binding protein [Streptomyces atratus]WPW26306.1 ABC transporter ATP-binding protein [Streptomyces atratus]GGT65819.1 dipeptide/oligopeptide/nickel ABC transporter ATP-binding protein [Streptomyces atratus]
MTELLTVEDLRVALPVQGQMRTVIHQASFAIGPGEALGLIGESGSGKSMTARAVGRLLPAGAQVSGQIMFDGEPVLELAGAALRRYRTTDVAMIFQDPRAHINPVRTIGDFLTEGLRSTLGMRRRDADRKAVSLLAEVGVEDGERRLRQYPHQLSGGLLQRVMIASALVANPRLLLADEPTTALDVTTQSEVMGILDRLRRDHGVAMLFITHDLELATAVCDRISVLYAGTVVESQDAESLHAAPRHPYTAALLASRPSLTVRARRLPVIGGRPLAAFEAPEGCAFTERCRWASPVCEEGRPAPETHDHGQVNCHRTTELGILGSEAVVTEPVIAEPDKSSVQSRGQQP